jgi:hypothetical protein
MCRLILLLLSTGVAQAGMTSIVLTDLAETRIEVISFFIVGYLALTLVVKFLSVNQNQRAESATSFSKVVRSKSGLTGEFKVS